MDRFMALLLRALFALVPIIGVGWVFSVPDRFGVALTFQQVVGTLLGLAGGIALALNVETLVPAIERLFGIQFLSPDVYYISDLPSDLHWSDVHRIAAMSLLLSLLATLYPARRAASIPPAEVLRYE